MFVCPKYKALFVAIPKTGTRSVYDILLGKYEGYVHKEHEQIIPEQYKEYFSFITVRNPYDRACSEYWSTCHKGLGVCYGGFQEKFEQKNIPNTLENFLSFRLGLLWIPQYKFYENNRIDQILRFENLQNDFKTLPFLTDHIELPKINTTTVYIEGKYHNIRPHWKKLITPKAGRIINEFFAKDFEMFNYEKIDF